MVWQPVIISILEEPNDSVLAVDDGDSRFLKKCWYVATTLQGIKSHRVVLQLNLSVMNMDMI
jgi:hypothetical protein